MLYNYNNLKNLRLFEDKDNMIVCFVIFIIILFSISKKRQYFLTRKVFSIEKIKAIE